MSIRFRLFCIGIHLINFFLPGFDHVVNRQEKKFPRYNEDCTGVEQHKQRRPKIDANETLKLSHSIHSSLSNNQKG